MGKEMQWLHSAAHRPAPTGAVEARLMPVRVRNTCNGGRRWQGTDSFHLQRVARAASWCCARGLVAQWVPQRAARGTRWWLPALACARWEVVGHMGGGGGTACGVSCMQDAINLAGHTQARHIGGGGRGPMWRVRCDNLSCTNRPTGPRRQAASCVVVDAPAAAAVCVGGYST